MTEAKAPDLLPFLAPGASCNARLHRGPGYCPLDAGSGTTHPGFGRCRLHGGAGGSPQDGGDGPRDLMVSLGLGQIIDIAETMTHEDQEYLMEVGNNALVVTRAKILARLQQTDTSAKEMADLTTALVRVDTILSKYPDEEDPDAAPNMPTALDAEMARVTALEAAEGR